MGKDKFLHDIATKVMTTQLSLEVVMRKLEAGWQLDSEDNESIKLAFEASRDAAELVRKAREHKKEMIAKTELPLLPGEDRPPAGLR